MIGNLATSDLRSNELAQYPDLISTIVSLLNQEYSSNEMLVKVFIIFWWHTNLWTYKVNTDVKHNKSLANRFLYHQCFNHETPIFVDKVVL